jgi:hypothetical protein
MKSFTFAFVATLAFIGCKPKGGDCTKAVDHSMELSKAEMQKTPGMDDATMQKMKDLGVKHCTDDKWPDDAINCMIAAKTMGDAQACYGKLSKDQRDKMNKAAMEMMTPAGSAAP